MKFKTSTIKMSAKRLSKCDVNCGYCGMSINHQNLKSYCKNVHDEAPIVKGQTQLFGIGSSSTVQMSATQNYQRCGQY